MERMEEENGSVMRKPFMALPQFGGGGDSMKTALAVLALLIACLWAGLGLAQSEDRFQSIGGEYGRNIIGSLTANETRAATSNNDSNSTLWNWGTIPKGSMLVNGSLSRDPFNNPGSIENPESSYVQVGVDAFTGRAIYSYKPPNGAAAKYFYVDAYTGLPVYVEWGDITTDGYSSAGAASQSYVLPSAFR